MSIITESLYLYEHLFASFFDLVIDKNFIKGKKGGERIQNVCMILNFINRLTRKRLLIRLYYSLHYYWMIDISIMSD